MGLLGLLLLIPPAGARAGAASPGAFTAFESGQVRPLALSRDGRRLFAVNTPDNRLEIFHVGRGALRHAGSVPVGLEPVAVAVRHPGEVWVVNHLSDSVSVVDVTGRAPRVVRTLLVGDEPRDVVFAGPGRGRAFVTTAHRGQNGPHPRGEYARPGAGRADVWVFDARHPGDALGGEPLRVLTLFGDKPRALAASPDGRRVYAAVFRSGNRTAIVPGWAVCNGGEAAPPCRVRDTTYPGGLPAPNANAEGVPAPDGSLIVRQDAASGAWLDELGRDWSAAVRFDLPDLDVFEIDATASPPRSVRAWSDVGTVLYGLAVNPASGAVYVSNTEAFNEVRFEGRGELAAAEKVPGEPPSVRGHLHEARITVLRDGSGTPRHLNDHIDYDVVPSPPGTRERSLATPLGMAVSRDGETLYVAALGSDRIGVVPTRALEDGSSLAGATRRIPLPGGPTGLVLDERRNRLYALARFDNAVVAVDPRSGREVQRVALHNPEPESLVAGRRFLYDARLTSSNGEASCAGCHVFGDVDDLAWDLGDPDGLVTPNPNPTVSGGPSEPFHPMKGPMTTQTLRGMAAHGPMHWRGDRTGGNAVPPGDPLDERAAFEAFAVAFEGLLGRAEPLAAEAMSSFTDFALQLTPPPNPIRRLDGTLRDDEQSGREVFFERATFGGDPERPCQSCHRLDPEARHFGTSGRSGSAFKVPQLRTLYQKVGMFGVPTPPLVFGTDPFLGRGDYEHTGPQVRGFGFQHDGAIDTVARFVSQITFLLADEDVRDLEAFLMVFDSDLAPVVGQQVTLRRESSVAARRRVDLLVERAATPRSYRGSPATECDLVVKGVVRGEPRGWVRTPDGRFLGDRADEPPWSERQLRALARRPGQELTWTCAPPGSGVRMGVDRDGDGVLDGDERIRSAGRSRR